MISRLAANAKTEQTRCNGSGSLRLGRAESRHPTTAADKAKALDLRAKSTRGAIGSCERLVQVRSDLTSKVARAAQAHDGVGAAKDICSTLSTNQALRVKFLGLP